MHTHARQLFGPVSGAVFSFRNAPTVAVYWRSTAVLNGINQMFDLACILKVSKNQGGFDLLSPLDSSRMLGTWEIVS